MSTQESFIDFFRHDRFETIILIDDKTPPANASGVLQYMGNKKKTFYRRLTWPMK